MKTIRKLIFVLSALMGVWVIGSFVGVMFNVANAGFWTTSLMWALLASVIVMPALVVAHHANNRRAARKAAQHRAQTSAPPIEEQPPFIEEEEQEGALWPEPENRSSQR
jgi:type VI protein secretion system component VasK